jgi:hypothetical protein
VRGDHFGGDVAGKDDILGWGGEALWRDHVPALRSMENPSLPDYLIAQLGEDGIKNNATRAADLLRLGMIADRARYADALAAWWRTHPSRRRMTCGRRP